MDTPGCAEQGCFQRDLEIIQFEKKKRKKKKTRKNMKKAATQHNKTARLPAAAKLLIELLFQWSWRVERNPFNVPLMPAELRSCPWC